MNSISFCTKCGEKLIPHGLYCPSCGHKLNGDDSEGVALKNCESSGGWKRIKPFILCAIAFCTGVLAVVFFNATAVDGNATIEDECEEEDDSWQRRCELAEAEENFPIGVHIELGTEGRLEVVVRNKNATLGYDVYAKMAGKSSQSQSITPGGECRFVFDSAAFRFNEEIIDVGIYGSEHFIRIAPDGWYRYRNTFHSLDDDD